MNDRGLDLTPPDILKAEIVGDIDKTDQREYSEKWENIEQELGRGRFADLFAHVRMVYAKALLSHIFSATAASEGLGNPVARAS